MVIKEHITGGYGKCTEYKLVQQTSQLYSGGHMLPASLKFP